jgi:hypothetical protein
MSQTAVLNRRGVPAAARPTKERRLELFERRAWNPKFYSCLPASAKTPLLRLWQPSRSCLPSGGPPGRPDLFDATVDVLDEFLDAADYLFRRRVRACLQQIAGAAPQQLERHIRLPPVGIDKGSGRRVDEFGVFVIERH